MSESELRAELARLRQERTAARAYGQRQFLARVEMLRLADQRTKERDRALAVRDELFNMLWAIHEFGVDVGFDWSRFLQLRDEEQSDD